MLFTLTWLAHQGILPVDCLQAQAQWTIVLIHHQTINVPLYQPLCLIAINRESHQSKGRWKKTYLSKQLNLFEHSKSIEFYDNDGDGIL